MSGVVAEQPKEAATTNEDNNNNNEQLSSSSSSSKSKKQEMVSFIELFSFARTMKVKLCIVASFICAAISGSVYPFMAFYFARSFEDLGGDTSSDTFMPTVRDLAYSFLVMGTIALISMTAQATLIEVAASEMTQTFKTEWFNALLRQDITYYDIMDVSGEGTIITVNGNKYRKGIGRKLAQGIQFLVTFVGGFIYAFTASWQVSLAVLAIAPFITLTTLFMVKMNTSVTARSNASYAKAGSIASTSVTSIRTVLSLNAVELMITQFKNATLEAYNGAVSTVAYQGFAYGSNMASMLLSYIVVTLFGAYLLYDAVKQDGCDPSGAIDGVDSCDPSGLDVFGALMGITFSAAVLPQISVTIEALVGARVACYPALAVIRRTTVVVHDDNNNKDKKSEKSNNKNVVEEKMKILRRGGSKLPDYIIDSSSDKGLKPNTVNGDIEFNNVSFHYPTRIESEVFSNFSLKIDAGKTIALVGPSGSGKSTVVQLIERFYDPTKGSITLDGIDLRDLNVKWLRQHIALVQQEPKLFECSIRENIALGAPGCSYADVEEAAKLANAHDFIHTFPNGYDTEVGALGDQLSGGQRQRIAIARCLVKHPRILLLDEATSALDSESEVTVQQAIDDLMELKSMTTFVIAHRLSTIKNADMIAVVEDGSIVETGTHSELLSKRGAYFKLVEAQKLPTDTANETPSSSMHESIRESVVDSSAHDSTVNSVMLEFDNVHFEYPSRPDAPVFRGLNLKVHRGETLALVGPSGSGKSTTIQLIECFYRPTSGVVKFKGVDMEGLNVGWLRSQLGLVSQTPTLFDCSIEENIRYGCPNASHEQVVEAAKRANAHDFIMKFPEGYGTSVGQGSTLVSGGQKQRICIARALVKQAQIYLLDEATSALDSQSEKVVQDALDKIMFDSNLTCVVIAHRLSTIRNADRIAVVANGKIREIGTHDELMAKPNGHYKRLQLLQNLDVETKGVSMADRSGDDKDDDEVKDKDFSKNESGMTDEEFEIDKEEAAANAKRAKLLASSDISYLIAGGIGAVFASFVFPAWGFIFAYMIEVLYTPVFPCPPLLYTEFDDCQDYWDSTADDMQEKSLKVFYGFIGIIFSSLFGFTLMFWGFGMASERMNKRIRDSAFTSLLRQEVAWFDVRSPGTITSRLSDDAAVLHSFSGEPIRSLAASVASVAVGVVVSFVYMWPFALLTLAILPLLGFGAETEMQMYYGEDEGDDHDIDKHSPGGIVIEALSNIRTVASLTLEEERVAVYHDALKKDDPHPARTNMIKGGASGLGQFVQFWGIALMFWWGGWLLYNYPNKYSYRDFLISMFSIMFCLYGLTIAMEGAVDKDKAKRAAARIFELTDRKSAIDPLGEEGLKDVDFSSSSESNSIRSSQKNDTEDEIYV